MTMNIIYINKLFRKYQYKNTMKSEYMWLKCYYTANMIISFPLSQHFKKLNN